ncbi:MAG: dipeptidyl aminopeptidase/acylaminoacyl peptidase [Planctomycetota bacterium]|jgi:dipeptidyl aminopeptidase/acylaminoacyl peptidase
MRRFIPLVFAILLSMSPMVIAQTKTLTTHQVCELSSIGTALVDPTGELVAYTRSYPHDALKKDATARSELWLTKRGAGEGRRFLSSSFGNLSWSADGSALLFTSKRTDDKFTSLYSISKDGGEANRLFIPHASIRYYSMSADGNRIAYVCNVAHTESPWKKRGFDQFEYGAEKYRVQLRVRDLKTQEETQIPVEGAPWELAFSPDGKTLAFWASPSASIDDRYMARSLWTCDAKGGKPTVVAPLPGKVGAMHWGPKSERIAFISGDDINDPKEGVLRVAHLGTASGKIVTNRLTPKNFLGHIADMNWIKGKDGQDGFVLLVNQGLKSYYMYQPAAGGEIVHMTKSVDVDESEDAPAVWRSLDVKQAADGTSRFVAVAESANHPKELFIDGKRITFSNPGILDGADGKPHAALGKQVGVKYTARDGIEIEGVLIYPVGYKKGTRYPLICMIHGGPEAHYSHAWLTAYSMPGQVAAGKGYFVFHPNYRSSTGRGVEFSKLGQGKSAQGEFDDIVDGVDYLVEQGLVDKERVGITGGSYGGYASAWGATYYSKRFAASVMFVGISEQLSKIFTTDIPNESFLVHWRMRPWGNWQKYLEASPIYYIERAQTPILIMHGEKDPRVPVAQSIELYRALQMKGGVPSRLVLYPREQHGNRRSAARLDYGLRQMRWFDRFLKKDGKGMPPFEINYEPKN